MSHLSQIIAARMEKAGNLINAYTAGRAYKAPEQNFLVKGLIAAANKVGIKIQPLNVFMARWDSVVRIVGFTTEWNGAGGLFDPLVRGEKPIEGVAVGEVVKTTDDHGRKILIFMTALGPVVVFQRYNAEGNYSVFAHLPQAVAELLDCDTSGDLGISTYEWLTGKGDDVIKRVETAQAKKAEKAEGAKSEDKAADAKAEAKEALDEFAQATADLNKEAEELKNKEAPEPTSDVGKAFQEHLKAIEKSVDFVPAWHGETDYFEGVARGSVFVEPLGDKPVKTVDDHGRPIILMQTQKGMIVIFQRYTDQADTIKVQMHEELAKAFKLHQTDDATVDMLTTLLGDPSNPDRLTAIDMVKVMNNFGNGKKH